MKATEKAKAMNTDKMKQYATIENGIICINPMTIGPVAEYALNSTEIIDVSLGSNKNVKTFSSSQKISNELLNTTIKYTEESGFVPVGSINEKVWHDIKTIIENFFTESTEDEAEPSDYQELLDSLNSYHGSNIYQDLIYDASDFELTEAVLGYDCSGDFVLPSGQCVIFSEGRWQLGRIVDPADYQD